MSVRGLGSICFLISDYSHHSEMVIKVINSMAEKIYHTVVIVNDENFEKARRSFSDKVELYNISMNYNKLGKKTLRSILLIIQPAVIFVMSYDIKSVVFARYSKVKIKKIIYKEDMYIDDVICNGDENMIANTMIKNVEKEYNVDCYAKFNAQKKAFGAYMTFREYIIQILFHRKRVEHSFFKSWGYKLPNKPETYNEKLNWLKIYGKTYRFRYLADKYKVRVWLSKNGYENLLLESYAIERKLISKKTWDKLPNKFVIKPSNSSGYNIFIANKDKTELQMVNRVLKSVMRVKYGILKHEPVYSSTGRIILMNYIENLIDYKFFCFNGRVEFIAVVKERLDENKSKEPYQIIFNRNFEEMPFSYGYERGSINYEKPQYFGDMLFVVEKLSKGIPHVRIDMMGDSDKFYFGEFTFFSGGGRDRFNPPEFDLIVGKMLDLEKY